MSTRTITPEVIANIRTVGIEFLIDNRHLLEEEEPAIALHNLKLKYTTYSENSLRTKITTGQKLLRRHQDEVLYYIATDADKVPDVVRGRIASWLAERGLA